MYLCFPFLIIHFQQIEQMFYHSFITITQYKTKTMFNDFIYFYISGCVNKNY